MAGVFHYASTPSTRMRRYTESKRRSEFYILHVCVISIVYRNRQFAVMQRRGA